MKNRMIKQKIIVALSKLLKFNFLLIGVLFVLPYYLIEPLMWIWVLYFVIDKKQFNWSFNTSKVPLLFLIGFYILQLLSLSYSSNTLSGVSTLNLYLPILLLSVLMYGTPTNYFPVIKTVNSVVISTYIGLFICLGFVVYTFFTDNSLTSILNVNPISAFREVLGVWMHRSYLALALSISLLFFYLIVDGKVKLIFWWITFVMVTLFVWYSGARISMFYLLLIGFGIAIDVARRYVSIKTLIGLSILLLAGLATLMYNHPSFAVFKNILNLSSEELYKLDPRFQIWTSVKSVLDNSIIFGVGIGDVKESLLQKYTVDDFKLGAELGLNSHNQFLQVWMESGILGIVLFSLAFVSVVFSYKRIPLMVRILYVITLMGAFFVETMLSRAGGREVFMFSFLLLYALNGKDSKHYNLPNRWIGFASIGSLIIVIALIIYPYKTMFKVDLKDPTTFAIGNYQVLQYDELPGPVPSNLPEDAQGLLLNNLTFKSMPSEESYMSNVYLRSFTKLDDWVEAGAYAFVSKDFNGGNVFLFSKNQLNEYNMDTCLVKGEWQYLSISHSCVNGELVLGLYLEPMDYHQSFKELEGYVIFADPQFEITNSN